MSNKKNVIWIVIDTLRSDMLASCLSKDAVPNEIDHVLQKGVLFTDVMTTGGSTRVSAPAYFTSMRPGLTGMTNHEVQAIRNFNDEAVTITEHFKHYGYRTLRWDDSSLDSCQPKRGFDVFESGYPTLEHTPDNDYDNDRRDAFIKQLRQDETPFFTNIHLDYIHDFGGYQKRKWSTEEYLDIVALQAKDFHKLWTKISPGPNDIVVVTSDHGCILDQDYVEYDKERPWGFSNARTRVLASFIAEDLSPCKKHSMIRSIDIGPTLLEMAVGKEMKAHGVSLVPILSGEKELTVVGIAERSVALSKESLTDFACIREKEWSYFLSKGEPLALFNNDEGDLVENYIGEKPEIEKHLHGLYTEIIKEGPQTPTELYQNTGLSVSEIRQGPEVSILLPVFEWSEEFRLCLESLLDQILATEVILLDADSSGEVARNISDNYQARLFLKHVDVGPLSLQEMLNQGLNLAKGQYSVTATPLCQYTENFCYLLRNEFLSDESISVAYPNLKRVIRDARELEYIGNDECFDEILFSRLGSGFEHNAYAASQTLPYFNEIGASAMFRTDMLRNAGGFASGAGDFIGQTWHMLSKLGRLRHTSKGLLLSKDPSILRPVMPALDKKYPFDISVLIPLLESESMKHLPKFLTMLSSQEISKIEVILMHLPDSGDFLEKIIELFPNINIRVKSHEGSSYNLLNMGVFASRGKYLFWADPTDMLLPNCLTTLMTFLQENKTANAVRCGHLLKTPSAPPSVCEPLCRALDFLLEPSDMRGVLYKRDLHDQSGVFKEKTVKEIWWGLCLQLALIAPFNAINEPLILAVNKNQFSFKLQADSYQRIVISALKSMGGMLDLVRLYEEVFQNHSAGQARFIVEDEMLLVLTQINNAGVNCAGMIKVPKI